MLEPRDSGGTVTPGGRGFLRMGEFRQENDCAGRGGKAEEVLLESILLVLMVLMG